MEKITQQNSNFCVPKLVHFIWAGGDKLMEGKKEVDNVAAWCKANPNCQINLWVDYNSYSGNPGDMFDTYKTLFEAHGIRVIRGSDIKSENNPALIIRDINEIEDYKNLLSVVRSEINQIYPNFGCSSDIIRLLLLRKGGCYFDQDVRCNPILSLEQSGIFKPREIPLLILEHRPQRATPEPPMTFESGGSVVIHGKSDQESLSDKKSDASPKSRSSSDEAAHESKSGSGEPSPKSESSSDNSYKRFMKLTFDELGNDAIICTPNNPVIEMQLDKILENYHLHASHRDLIIAECYGERDRKNRSIIRTGPTVTQTIVKQNLRLYSEGEEAEGLMFQFNKYDERVIDFEAHYNKKLNRDDYVEVVEFQPMRSKTRELTAPETNSQNWLNVPIKEIKEGRRCRQIILERIKFEIQHFKILRLDDHIDAMLLSMGIANGTNSAAYYTKQLLEEISHLNLHDVQLAQLTLLHKESTNFCLSKRLKTIIDLDKSGFQQALYCLTNFSELSRSLSYLKHLQQSSMTDIRDFVTRLEPDFMKKINNQLNLSITRLEALVNNIDKLPLERQIELCRFIRDNCEFFEYAQEFYSCSHTDLMGVIDRCFVFAEKHLSTLLTLVKQDNSIEIKSTESDEKDRDITVDRKSNGAK